MKFTSATALSLATLASASAPSGDAPAGCSASSSGTFEITPTTVINKRGELEERTALMLTLNNGVLTDAKGRTGYIAKNRQFQFDAPVQAGAIFTSGFSACSNGSLALGSSAVFYECLSGGFYNLYDESWAAQCKPIELVMSGGGSSVTQVGDGQGQAPTNAVTQIGDGQGQAPTGVVTQIGDGQPQVPTGSPVTQIGDGQPQAPTGSPVTQIGDGQPQAPTGSPVSQIGDGQPQAPTATAAAVSQISDGQPQAPTATAAAVSQISDGQPQAPTGVVSQISDGQPQAPTGASNSTLAVVPMPTAASSSPLTVPQSGASKAFSGAAAAALVAGLGAVLCL